MSLDRPYDMDKEKVIRIVCVKPLRSENIILEMSSGLEPLFNIVYTRKIMVPDEENSNHQRHP